MKSKYVAVLMISATLLFVGCSSNTETGTAVPVFEPVEIEEEAQPEIIEEQPVEEEGPVETEGPIEEEPEEDLGYTIEDIEAKQFWTTQACNVRNFPSTESDNTIIGKLAYSEEVTVIGRVEYNDKIWFVLSKSGESSEEKQLVSSSLLSETKPQPQQQQASGGGTTQQSNGGDGSLSTDDQAAIDYATGRWGSQLGAGGMQDFGGGGFQ